MVACTRARREHFTFGARYMEVGRSVTLGAANSHGPFAMLLVCASVAVVGTTGCAAMKSPEATVASSHDPAEAVVSSSLDPVEARVLQELGEPARRCGRVRHQFLRGRGMNDAEAGRVAACIRQSRARGDAFFYSVAGGGIDSFVARGVFGSRGGAMTAFRYESELCFSPPCTATTAFRLDPCKDAASRGAKLLCEIQ